MTDRRTRISALAVALTLSAAGCASAADQVPPPQPAPVEPGPRGATLASVTTAVLADAAGRTGLKHSELVVESATAVTWADGSLGCPEPGMNYTMALVPGYRIRIRAGSALLDYHTSQRGHFILCPAGRAQEPAGGDQSQLN